MINSGIKDLKEEIEVISEDEKKKQTKSQIRYYKLLKRFLNLINKNKQEKH